MDFFSQILFDGKLVFAIALSGKITGTLMNIPLALVSVVVESRFGFVLNSEGQYVGAQLSAFGR
jgi:hypothetical protein